MAPSIEQPTPRWWSAPAPAPEEEERTGWTPSPPASPAVRVLKRAQQPNAPKSASPAAAKQPKPAPSKAGSVKSAKSAPSTKAQTPKPAPSAAVQPPKPTQQPPKPTPLATTLNKAAKEFTPFVPTPLFKPAQPAQPVKISRPAEAEATSPAEAAKPADVPKAADTVKPTEPAKPAEASRPVLVDVYKPPHIAKSPKVSKPSPLADTFEPAGVQHAPEPVANSNEGWSGWPTDAPADTPASDPVDPPASAAGSTWSGWPSDPPRPDSRQSCASRASAPFTTVLKGARRQPLPSQTSAFMNRFAALEAEEAAERAAHAEDWSAATSPGPSAVPSGAPSVAASVAPSARASVAPSVARSVALSTTRADEEREEDEPEEEEGDWEDEKDEGEEPEHSGWTPPSSRVRLPSPRPYNTFYRSGSLGPSSANGSSVNGSSVSGSAHGLPPPGSNYKGRKFDPSYVPPPAHSRELSSTSGASRRRKRHRAAEFAASRASSYARAPSPPPLRAFEPARYAEPPQRSASARPASATPPIPMGPNGTQIVTPRQASQLLDNIMHWILASLEADVTEADLLSDAEDESFPYGPARPPPEDALAKRKEYHNGSYLWRALWRDLRPVRVRDAEYRRKGGGEKLFMLLVRESRLYREECKYLKQQVEGRRGERAPAKSTRDLEDMKAHTDGVRVGIVRGYEDGMHDGFARGYDKGFAEGRAEAEKEARREARRAKRAGVAAEAEVESESETERATVRPTGARAPPGPELPRPRSVESFVNAFDPQPFDREPEAEGEDKDAQIARLEAELKESQRRVGVRDESIEILMAKNMERASENMHLREMLHKSSSVQAYNAQAADEQSRGTSPDNNATPATPAPVAASAAASESSEELAPAGAAPSDSRLECMTLDRDHLGTRLEETVKELDDTYEKLYEAEDRVQLLGYENATLAKDKERLKAEIASLMGQLDAAKRRVADELRASDELAAVADEAARARARERSEADDELAELADEAEALRRAKDGLAAQLAAAQGEVELLQRARGAADARAEQFNAYIAQQDAELLAAETKYAGALAELVAARAQLEQQQLERPAYRAPRSPPPSRPASHLTRSTAAAAISAAPAPPPSDGRVDSQQVVQMIRDEVREGVLALSHGAADSVRDLLRAELREGLQASLRDEKANWTMKQEWACRKRGYNDAVREMSDPPTAAGNMHRRLIREREAAKAGAMK